MFYLFKRLVLPADTNKSWWLVERDDGVQVQTIKSKDCIVWQTPIRKILDSSYHPDFDVLGHDYLLLQDNVKLVANHNVANNINCSVPDPTQPNTRLVSIQELRHLVPCAPPPPAGIVITK